MMTWSFRRATIGKLSPWISGESLLLPGLTACPECCLLILGTRIIELRRSA